MTDAYVRWLFEMVSGPVYVAVALVGVSSLVLVIVPIFRTIFKEP
jgi:hypothetical protein